MELENIVANTVLLKAREGENLVSVGKGWAMTGKEPRAFSGLNQGWSFLAQRPLSCLGTAVLMQCTTSSEEGVAGGAVLWLAG